MADNKRWKKLSCAPSDIALKSLFLGPQSENGDWFEARVREILRHTIEWRRRCFPNDGSSISNGDITEDEFRNLRTRLEHGLATLLKNLESETPKFTPRYIGHMVSEISLPALLAEFALLLHNPNNASHEAARVGLTIEKEAVAALSDMIGFDPSQSRGHFTSCGTIANFEALWRALHWFDQKLALSLYLIERGIRQENELFNLCHMSHLQHQELLNHHDLNEEHLSRYSLLKQGPWSTPIMRILKQPFLGPVILVPGNRHYSWPKAASVFGVGSENTWTIELDEHGRLDLHDLKRKINLARADRRPIICVVSVAGTTELGEIDPVADVQAEIDRLAAEDGVFLWHHVDAAYGGYFTSLLGSNQTALSPYVSRSLAAIAHVDSVTIDPHKLGYVPYACGAFLSRDVTHYKSFHVQAPYLQLKESTFADWSTTLEGSRSAAGAAAVWLTSKVVPLKQDGFGKVLEKTIMARDIFTSNLSGITDVHLVTPADTNVLCFSVAKPNESLSSANQKALNLFHAIERGPNFSVSRTMLLRSNYSRMIRRLCHEWNVIDDDQSDLVVIRLVLMNPFIASKEMDTDFAREFAHEIESLLRIQNTKES